VIAGEPGPGPRRIGQGVYVSVSQNRDRVPVYNHRTGAHAWVVSCTFAVDPTQWGDPEYTPLLDGENLVLLSPPVCWHCERVYTPALTEQRCPGGDG
jgi:hypothetical protein